jgi:photosystem II stability/assembly factor-like uncharacterized protein
MKKTSSRSKKSTAHATSLSGPVALLVATRKGAFLLRSKGNRRGWRISKPIFLGHIVHHVVQDPREPRTLLVAARTGHLGPTVFRSHDSGKTWKEATRPPAFPKAPEGQKGQVVDHTFWLTPGHASERGTWYAGTSPQGLFRSEDGGATWTGVAGMNEHPEYSKWMGAVENGTPNGPKLHSVLVDPRDKEHLYLAMSSGGVFESGDAGRTWKPLVKGLEVVESFDASVLQYHDPHCMRFAGGNPDRLYQQNHCGIYRIDRPGETWKRIGKSMPKSIGDVGFSMTVHPRDANVLWVLPMDGSGVWPRTSPGGKPAIFVSRNGGKSWQRQAKGLPAGNAWWTVKRQAMCADAHDPVGLYFGTTSGEVWASRKEGARWKCIARHLPEIYAVEVAHSSR